MNSVDLIGRLARDPFKTKTSNGYNSCLFTLAVPRSYKKDTKIDYVSCRATGKISDVMLEYAKKGRLVFVSGRISTWLTDDGVKKHSNYICDIYRFEFLDSDQNNNPFSSTCLKTDISDNPFDSSDCV